MKVVKSFKDIRERNPKEERKYVVPTDGEELALFNTALRFEGIPTEHWQGVYNESKKPVEVVAYRFIRDNVDSNLIKYFQSLRKKVAMINAMPLEIPIREDIILLPPHDKDMW